MPLFKQPCGLQFREISIKEEEVTEVQENPNACFRMKYEEALWIVCVVEPVRPVARSRRLMKKIHDLCLEAKLEGGEVPQAMVKS